MAASAQVIVWDGAGISLLGGLVTVNLGASNWTGGVAPTGTQTAEFDTVSGGLLGILSTLGINLSSNGLAVPTGATYGSVLFTSNAPSLLFNASVGTTLTINSSFTNQASGTTITIDPALTLGSGFTSFTGPASGSTTLQLAGALSSTNGFTLTQNFDMVLTGSPAGINGTVTVQNGSSLTFAEGSTTTIPTTIANNASVVFGTSSANTYTYSGAMSGNGTVTVNAALTMTNPGNAYSGTTTVNGGAVLQDSTTADAFSPNSSVQLNGIGQLIVNRNEVIGGLTDTGTSDVITINGPWTLKVNGTGSLGGKITSTGTLELAGTSFLTYGILDFSSSTAALKIDGGSSLQLGDGSHSNPSSYNVFSTTLAGSLNFDLTTAASYGAIGSSMTGGGTLNLAKGDLTLQGNSSYSGLTTLQTGTTLEDTAGSNVSNFSPNSVFTLNGSSTLDVHRNEQIEANVTNSNATISIDSGANLKLTGGSTIGGLLYGLGSVEIASGTTVLTYQATQSGGLTIDSGATLQVGSGGSTGQITGVGAVTDNGVLSYDVPASTSNLLNISGSGGLSVIGGNVTLGGELTYSGATSVSNAGSVLDITSSLPSGSAVTVGSGAALSFTGSSSPVIGNAINSSGTVLFGQNLGGSYTFSGALTGSGTVEVQDTTVFGSAPGANTYGGQTNVDYGKSLSDLLGTNNSFSPNSVINLGSNGTLNVYSVESVAGLVDSGASASYNVFSNGGLTVTGGGTINGTITTDGSLTFGGVNQAFTLLGNVSGKNGVVTVASGDTLTLGNGTAIGSTVHLGSIASNGAIVVNAPGLFTLDANMSSEGSLEIKGGTITLSGTNSFLGGTTVDAGATLADTNGGGEFSANSAITLSGSGSQLNVNGAEVIPGLAVANGATATIGGSGSLELDGASQIGGTLNGGGSLTFNGGSSALTLQGSGSVEVKQVTLESGSVVIGSGGTFTGLVGSDFDLGSGTTLKLFTSPGNITTLGGAITDSGSVDVFTGTLELSGSSNTYAGTTTIESGGILTDTSTASSFSPNSAVQIQGTGSLQLNSTEAIASLDSVTSTSGGVPSVSIGTGAALQISGGGTFNGTIGGQGGLEIDGGTFTAGGMSSYTGSTSIREGAELIFSGGSAPATSGIDVEGTVQFDTSGGSFTYSGGITGDGGTLSKVGGNTLTLSGGGLTTYGGDTTVSAGTLTDGIDYSFSPNSAMHVKSGAEVDVQFNESILNLEGSGTVQVETGQTLTLNGGGYDAYAFKGVIQGDGVLLVGGSDQQTFSGANLYTGGTTINNEGFLILNNGSGSGLGTGDVTIEEGSTLQLGNGNALGSFSGGALVDGTLSFNRTDSLSSPFQFGNTLSGGGSITFNNSGAVAFTAINSSFTGTATIAQGTVIAANASGGIFGTGDVQVTGGTLQGSGFVTSKVYVSGGGSIAAQSTTLAPTTLTLEQLSLQGGGNLQVTMTSADGTAGTNWGLLSMTSGICVESTSSSLFTISLVSTNGTGGIVGLSDFDNTKPYQWMIATTGTSISGFDPNAFAINTSSFLNDLGTGNFYLTSDGTSLFLDFTPVPEPSTWALLILGTGVVGWSGYRARRRGRA